MLIYIFSYINLLFAIYYLLWNDEFIIFVCLVIVFFYLYIMLKKFILYYFFSLFDYIYYYFYLLLFFNKLTNKFLKIYVKNLLIDISYVIVSVFLIFIKSIFFQKLINKNFWNVLLKIKNIFFIFFSTSNILNIKKQMLCINYLNKSYIYILYYLNNYGLYVWFNLMYLCNLVYFFKNPLIFKINGFFINKSFKYKENNKQYYFNK